MSSFQFTFLPYAHTCTINKETTRLDLVFPFEQGAFMLEGMHIDVEVCMYNLICDKSNKNKVFLPPLSRFGL